MGMAALDKVRGALATETAIDLTQKMVRIDSTCGKERAIALDLEAGLKALRIGKVWCEEIPNGRLNVLWEVDSGTRGPNLLLTGHLDTKPVCEGWESDPFSGLIADGRLHGHGVMDMKAGVGSLAGAVKTLADSGVAFRGKVTFAAVADHMGDQSGSIDLFNRHHFDHCILGELTDMQIYIAHRGRYYFDISTIGLAAHTCHKYAAVNAIELMLPVAAELSKLKYFPTIPQAIQDLVGAELFTAVGRIYGGLFPGGPSMIPDRCTIRVDTRPQPGVDLPEVRAIIDAALERAMARDPRIKLEVEVADIKNAFMVAPDAPIVLSLSEAWTEVMGEVPKLVGGSWLGDTASFGGLCETVIFGPGGYPVYQPNESLALSDIDKATRVYALTAAKILQAS